VGLSDGVINMGSEGLMAVSVQIVVASVMTPCSLDEY
jgi:hypothetical protein